MEEAQKRFVNRIHNRVFDYFFEELIGYDLPKVKKAIANALGDRYSPHHSSIDPIGGDFHRNLLAIETIYKYSILASYNCEKIDTLIETTLNESEIDLCVRWKNGQFLPSGAKLLDDELVNKTLHWLRYQKYENVLTPFEKGLSHLLHSQKRPELLSDVITDMYEALEALSKIVTNRPDKDLSANRELFIKEIKASAAYKKILSEYINYANKFRHGVDGEKKKPNLNAKEVESFVYLTGLFIRLAMP